MSIQNEMVLLGGIITGATGHRSIAVKLDNITWVSAFSAKMASIISARSRAGLPYGIEQIHELVSEHEARIVHEMIESSRGNASAELPTLFKTLTRGSATRIAVSALQSEIETFDIETSPARIMAALSKSVSMVDSARLKPCRLIDSIDASLAGPLVPPTQAHNRVRFGLTSLDMTIRANAGRLGIVAAHNSAGKSSLTTQAAVMTGRMQEHALVISCEMSEAEVHARAIACMTGVDAWSVMTRPMDPSFYPEWVRVAGAHIHTMHPGSGVEWTALEGAIRRADAEYNFSTIIIDYFQLLQPPDTASTRRGTDAQAKGEMSKAAKRLAQELDCCVILVSQFNREAEAGVEPKIDMLRDTGQLENDCDWAILMWEIRGDAPQDNRKVGMRIAKNRGGKRGDMVTSFFNPAVNRFVDATT